MSVGANKTVGLLALQGDYEMHRQAVAALKHETTEVRTPAELERVDCLIIPGGESTTMRKLMEPDSLHEAIVEFARTHSVMGTCAGLVLLGRETTGPEPDAMLGLLDCDTIRNGYGRQYYSFRHPGEIALRNGSRPYEMVFIRAPKITRIGGGVEVLGRLGDEPTMVRQGNILAMTFHPELSGDGAIHEYFLTQM
jgi:5'-phosphate synthase pdxT subunit